MIALQECLAIPFLRGTCHISNQICQTDVWTAPANKTRTTARMLLTALCDISVRNQKNKPFVLRNLYRSKYDIIEYRNILLSILFLATVVASNTHKSKLHYQVIIEDEATSDGPPCARNPCDNMKHENYSNKYTTEFTNTTKKTGFRSRIMNQ